MTDANENAGRVRGGEFPVECPHCNADLRDHDHPGFGRVIAVYDRDRDRTTHWLCPDCARRWVR